MKKIYSTCAIAFLICFNIYNSFAETKKALLIGIDIYLPTKETTPAYTASRGVWQNLEGCKNDANSIKEIIITHYGFDEKNITTVFDQDATHERIKKEIQKLIDNAQKGDVIFVYYAGHGSQVKNSKSYDGTGQDQTIVPCDFIDLRNKELAALWNKLVDKGVKLTLIFDSCHSGSIARGSSLPSEPKIRYVSPVDSDFMDPSHPPEIYEKGALVFSAVQREQLAKEVYDDKGTPHGVFTLSLMQSVSSAPFESAENIFNSAEAVLRNKDISYEDPVMEADNDRKKRGLFGDEVIAKGKPLIPVVSVNSSNEIILSGGYASGLNKGCILKKAAKSTDSITVVIDTVLGIGKSRATLLTGSLDSIKPGNLFECILWTASDKPNLKVWFPTSGFQSADLNKVCKNLFSSPAAKNYKWVKDPTITAPDYVISFYNGNWRLSGPNKLSFNFGKNISADVLALKIPRHTAVYLQLPPPADLIKALKIGAGSENSAIEITGSKEEPDYVLAGTYTNDSLCYAWIRPDAAENDTSYIGTLPVRTDWYYIGDNQTAGSLMEKAMRLGTINAWLNLPSPPDDGSYPFKFALKKADTDSLMTSGTVRDGERYGLALTITKENLKYYWNGGRRFIYIFVIDHDGKTQQLFPDSGEGNDRNDLPDNLYENELQIPLRTRKLPFEIAAPFGCDTYFLLTSDEELNNFEAFNAEGVKSRSLSRGVEDPLTQLLNNTRATTRGDRINDIPVTWSIQKLVVRSTP